MVGVSRAALLASKDVGGAASPETFTITEANSSFWTGYSNGDGSPPIFGSISPLTLGSGEVVRTAAFASFAPSFHLFIEGNQSPDLIQSIEIVGFETITLADDATSVVYNATDDQTEWNFDVAAVHWDGVGTSDIILTFGVPPADPVTFTGDTLRHTVSGSNQIFVGMVDNGADQFIAFGGILTSATAIIASSANGTTWNNETISANGILYSGAFDGTTYVLVGGSGSTAGRITTSTNGTSWTERTTNAPANTILFDVYWSVEQSLFIAVGETNANVPVILTSPDGTTWTSRAASQTPLNQDTVNSVTDSTGGFTLATGWYNNISDQGGGYKSSDGITWGNPSTLGLSNLQNYDLKYSATYDKFFSADASFVRLHPNTSDQPGNSTDDLESIGIAQQSAKGHIDSDGNYLLGNFGEIISSNGGFAPVTNVFAATAQARNAFQGYNGQYFYAGLNGADAVIYTLEI